MVRGRCSNCHEPVDAEPGEKVGCPVCGATGPAAQPGWNLVPEDADESRQDWADRASSMGTRFGAVAAFAIGIGLVLVGVGNGVWRLTSIDLLDGPGGLFGFLFHLATAATLVMLGATLLPTGLNLSSREARLSVEKPAVLFSVLWMVIGFFTLFTGAASQPNAAGGGIVLLLAGLFGIVATSTYDPDRTGSSITAGVLGLVAGGLLIGGVASVPTTFPAGRQFGSSIVLRYGSAVHASGYLVAILAAAVYPFVRADREGRAAVLLTASLGGVLWGIGELAFTANWLASAPWSLFSTLGPGAAAGYGFVIAGGLATIVGGIAGLGAALSGASYASVPLVSLLPNRGVERGEVAGADGASVDTVTCNECQAQVPASAEYCPECGEKLGETVAAGGE